LYGNANDALETGAVNQHKLEDAFDFGVPTPKSKRPKVLILGHAQHGKDTVAELLRDSHGFSFASSSFFAAEKAVRPALAACGVSYLTLENCYEDRVNWRAFWYEAISAYNRGGSRLAEEILKEHDLYVGMRSATEFEAAKHLFDQIVWVDASGRGVPPEPTSSFDIPYDPEVMDLVRNDSTIEELEREVNKLVGRIT
jgi:hypothetical protein